MSIECAYSFNDLYFAAFGKNLDGHTARHFGAANQETKNRIVSGWAARAGWQIKDKVGSDGIMYTAFAPSFEKQINSEAVC